LGLTADIRKDIYEQAPKLSFTDLKTFHNKEMSRKPYVYCIVAKDENIKMEDLQKLGEVKKLTLQELFGY